MIQKASTDRGGRRSDNITQTSYFWEQPDQPVATASGIAFERAMSTTQ